MSMIPDHLSTTKLLKIVLPRSAVMSASAIPIVSDGVRATSILRPNENLVDTLAMLWIFICRKFANFHVFLVFTDVRTYAE
jgi:hypothetical protein